MNSIRMGLVALAYLVLISSPLYMMPSQVNAATSINLNPSTGAVGSQTTITGDGFIGKLATIYWDEKKLLQNIPISKAGQINYTFEIPPSTKGDHIVKVTDDSNWANINATYTFSVDPSIITEPPWGQATNTIIIIGNGFTPGEKGIKTIWDGKQLSKSPISADKNGTWYSTFDVPYVAKGEYTMDAQGDATSAGEVTDLIFTVSPFCKANPLSGPVGTKIVVTGVGFRTGEDGITFTWDGPILDTNVVAQPNGRFSFTLTVPPCSKGKHILGIYGSSFTPKGIVPDIIFEVTPSIKLTPSDIINSRELKVEGSGFNANETVSVSYDKSNTGTSATTDAKGNFAVSFQTPVNHGKEHQVTITGNKGAIAQAIYTLTFATPPAPQLLFPGPGEKLQISKSVLDFIQNSFKSFGRTATSNKSADQTKNDDILTSMNWSVQGDGSGLKYTLQISKTQDFSNLVFTRDAIQGTTYNLTKSNLPLPGIYYWRVKASSGSGESGPWSNSWSFEVTPSSTLITAMSITIILLLIGAIVFAIIAVVNRYKYR